MNYLTRAIFGLLLGVGHTGYSMVSYHLLQTEDAKKILVLGELHQHVHPKMKEFFASFLRTLMAQELKRPFPLIVEYEKTTANHTVDSENIQALLACDALQQKRPVPPLSCRYFDARGSISAQLNSLRTGFSAALIEGLPVSAIQRHYHLEDNTKQEAVQGPEFYDDTAWQATAAKIKDRSFVINGTFLTKDYEAYRGKNLATMKALLERYQDKPILIAALMRIINEYQATHDALIKRYKDIPDFAIGFSEEFLLPSIEERLDRFEACERELISTDYAFAECTFFDYLSKTIAAEPCAGLLVGYTHASKVVDLLTAAGCTILEHQSLISYCYPLLQGMSFEDSFLSNLQSKVLPVLLEALTIKERSCFICSKESRELKMCSICKRARYCSAECQKVDWKTHKSWCKAPQSK